MKPCDPKDIAIKSFFLGPQAENGEWLKQKWIEIFDRWIKWRRSRFPQDGRSISISDQETAEFQASLKTFDLTVAEILDEFEKEIAKFSPRYIGHMVSDVSLPALLGHVCALLHNPNNTSREVSQVTSRFEEEAIADLAQMVGFGNSARGHFTSGGTIANLEALWRAWFRMDKKFEKSFGISLLKMGPWQFAKKYREIVGEEFLGPVVLAPGHKHFSWEKAVSMITMSEEAFWPVELNSEGRMCPFSLRAKLKQAEAEKRPVAMVVSVAGTTELGEVDPIEDIQTVLESLGEDRPWHHVDAAYGGYYASLLDSEEMESTLSWGVARSFRAIRRADSMTLDPHKLGYVPYACGAFIARDEEHYKTRAYQAAYLDSKNDSRWPFTLEGSRSGAGAAATWLSHRALGLNTNGYGRLLKKGLEARSQMISELYKNLPNVLILAPCDLNVICFTIAPQGSSLVDANLRADFLFKSLSQSPNFAVSRTQLSLTNYKKLIHRAAEDNEIEVNADHLTLIRLVLMNPFIVSREACTHFIKEFVKELVVVVDCF